MDLDEYIQSDGRPVSFQRADASFIEPHESGEGTRVVITTGDYHRELHLKEDYAFLSVRLREGSNERMMRRFHEDRGEVFDREAYLADRTVPF